MNTANSAGENQLPQSKINTQSQTEIHEQTPSAVYGKFVDQKAQVSKTQQSSKKVKSRKILLIEDDQDMGELLASKLSAQYSCRVDVATDPFEAINKITDSFYDLVILDWNLPALTGGETLRQVEKAMFFEPTLPIQWDHHEVPVVIFSSDRRQECPLRKSKHFNYVGFVSKVQPLGSIVENFGEYLDSRDGKGIWAS